MSYYLNEFNTIFSQLSAHGIMFNDSVKVMFLLVMLPLESQDTFWIALSNSTPANDLINTNVEGSLLKEEVNRKECFI